MFNARVQAFPHIIQENRRSHMGMNIKKHVVLLVFFMFGGFGLSLLHYGLCTHKLRDAFFFQYFEVVRN